MDSKIKYLFKDALILTLITLVSGFLLALVFQVTKEPIEIQAYEKKMNAYKEVFNGAKEFKDSEISKGMLQSSEKMINDGSHNYGKVGIEEILEAKDDSGKTLGYVATAYSDEGYGGRIRISVGYDLKDKKINKIAILEASETAGLGAKISTPEYSGQYSDKSLEQFKLVKGEKKNDDEIQAISGATISSSAVTNSVNAVLLVFNSGGTK